MMLSVSVNSHVHQPWKTLLSWRLLPPQALTILLPLPHRSLSLEGRCDKDIPLRGPLTQKLFAIDNFWEGDISFLGLSGTGCINHTSAGIRTRINWSTQNEFLGFVICCFYCLFCAVPFVVVVLVWGLRFCSIVFACVLSKRQNMELDGRRLIIEGRENMIKINYIKQIFNKLKSRSFPPDQFPFRLCEK